MLIEVLTSPTCPHCPNAVMMAKQIAKINPTINVVEIPVTTPQGYNKAVSIGIKTIPTILVDGKIRYVGAPSSLEELSDILNI